MSEQTVQEGIRDTLISMDEFNSNAAVIEDWSVLDGPISNAPYGIIEVSDELTARQDASSEETIWSIPLTLLVEFDGMESSRLALRDLRQAVIDKFNTVGTARSAGGLAATDIREIRTAGPIGYRYLTYNEYQNDELPTYTQQQLILEVREGFG